MSQINTQTYIPLSINDEKEKFYLCKYSGEYALGFRGDADFIRRSCNFILNNSISNRRLHKFYECFAYIIIETKEKLIEGLINQFRGEIILNREVPYLSEKFDEDTQEFVTRHDDAKIESLATERAHRFMNERIIYENFMMLNAEISTPAYEIQMDF